jgi:hypothetical protein
MEQIREESESKFHKPGPTKKLIPDKHTDKIETLWATCTTQSVHLMTTAVLLMHDLQKKSKLQIFRISTLLMYIHFFFLI